MVTGPEESIWTVVQDESGCVEGKEAFADYYTTKESYSEEHQYIINFLQQLRAVALPRNAHLL